MINYSNTSNNWSKASLTLRKIVIHQHVHPKILSKKHLFNNLKIFLHKTVEKKTNLEKITKILQIMNHWILIKGNSNPI